MKLIYWSLGLALVQDQYWTSHNPTSMTYALPQSVYNSSSKMIKITKTSSSEISKQQNYWCVQINRSVLHWKVMRDIAVGHLQRRISGGRFYTCYRTSHDQSMPANTTIPFGANPFQLNIRKSGLFKPLNILFLLWEEHPHICKEAGQPKSWVHRTNQTCLTSLFQDPVSFFDATLGVWPVFNTAKRN